MPLTGRSLVLHWPAGRQASSGTPLVLLFHGSGGNGRAMLDQSKLANTADTFGYVVAAPDGGIPMDKGFVWNIPGVPAVGGRMPARGDADDVAFVRRTIDWLVAQGCVDRTRVYATGLSGGGRMTSWLGCVAADRIAAIAPVVGLRAGKPYRRNPTRPDPASCRPSRPMPVMAFAGDADTTNPIAGGGAQYWQYPMRAAETRWAEINACKRPFSRSVTATVYEEGYADCRNGADVTARIVRGGTHSWVADNTEMMRFFAAHRRER